MFVPDRLKLQGTRGYWSCEVQLQCLSIRLPQGYHMNVGPWNVQNLEVIALASYRVTLGCRFRLI